MQQRMRLPLLLLIGLIVSLAVPHQTASGDSADSNHAGISQGGHVTVSWGSSIRTKKPAKVLRVSPLSRGTSSSSSDTAPAPNPVSEYDRRIAQCQLTHVVACVAWAEEALPGDPATPRPARLPPTRAEIEETAREVVLSLQLPAHAPRIGPDPAANEWGMAVVGHPLWLWTDAATSLSASRVQYGMAFDLSARLERVDFAMGDGTTVTCATTTPYDVGVRPGAPSPTCGHVYETASLPRGSYTVTATSPWSVGWSGMGLSGSIPAGFTASRVVPVGELQAVVTG